MTYGYIEDLKFAVEVFDEGGNLQEVLARLHDLDAARAAYEACRLKYAAKLIYLCQGGRTLRRSDRDGECARCDDDRWVCEAHDNRPWGISPRACRCGASGIPCPDRNRSNPPRPPRGFSTAGNC